MNNLSSLFFIIALSVLPVSGAAEDESLASENDRLDYEETRKLLIGNTLRYPGVGQSTYHANGTYTFTPEDNPIKTFGVFEVRRDGRVCLDMQQQFSDCSTFIKRNGIVFLLTPEGRRFKVSLELNAN